MPYTYYTKVTRDDALAIRAYLNTVPAVHNAVGRINCRSRSICVSACAAWNKLNFRPGPFKPDPAKARSGIAAPISPKGSAIAACAIPRRTFSARDKASEALQGYALQGWFAPNITNDPRRGLGSWSIDEIASLPEDRAQHDQRRQLA